MAYASFGSEVDTSALWQAVVTEGKTLLLPRIDKSRDAIRVYAVRDLARDLETNRWGIAEPRPGACLEIGPAELDFVFVPGVAPSTHGTDAMPSAFVTAFTTVTFSAGSVNVNVTSMPGMVGALSSSPGSQCVAVTRTAGSTGSVEPAGPL